MQHPPESAVDVALVMQTSDVCPLCREREIQLVVTNRRGAKRGFCKVCLADVLDNWAWRLGLGG